ncbi:unnamed protein product [Ostreobium quekettii]|uniref:Exportin-4 n=1 Tax=Ostreobium quekettii TaxID=121088 RepID=A0A8S1IS72_9CHLO|nr:unnamed protein product [Ostreobium quekettii]|eukprot:evm.model.scf_103EXC.2 EVM.evm.TU.scf_103EXC.2   scf_103EXC:29188-46715(+)
MEAVKAIFEQACEDFKDPAKSLAASRVLVDIRDHPDLILACQQILHTSPSPDTQFQAAVALREATARRWDSLPQEQRHGVQGQAMAHALAAARDPGAKVVVSGLVGLLAVLLKRAWGDMSQGERAAYFEGLERTVAGAGNVHARRVGIQILESIVTEFAPITATPLGLSWGYHEMCRASLEESFLKDIFRHAVHIGSDAARSGAAAMGTDAGTCSACLALLCSIIGWDFRPDGLAAPGSASQATGRPGSDAMRLRPPASWSDVLLAPATTAWLVELLSGFRTMGDVTRQLMTHARQLLVLLCSISGDIFNGQQGGREARLSYLHQILQALLAWIQPPEAAVQKAANVDDEELTDGCRAIFALALGHTAADLQCAAPPDQVPGGGILGRISGLLLACIAVGGLHEEAVGTWVGNCTDMLLEAWSNLVQSGSQSQTSVNALPQEISSCSASIFQSLAEASLREACEGAHKDLDEGDKGCSGPCGSDDALARAAVVGRACGASSLPLLTRLLNDRRERLLQCSASGQDPSATLEELVWLLSTSACVLADAGEGETPLVPQAISEALQGQQAWGGGDPVEGLSNAILGVVSLCLDSTTRAAISPRLMEVAVWSLARWADTYLLSSEDALGLAMKAAFGQGPRGAAALSVSVRVVQACFQHYPGENDLHALVASKLLRVLTRRPPLCCELWKSDDWKAFVQLMSADHFRKVNDKAIRLAMQSLYISISGTNDCSAAKESASTLMGHSASQLANLPQNPNLHKIAAHPQVADEVCRQLEALRGAARGTAEAANHAVWAMFSALFQPLLQVMEAFRAYTNVTYLILKLAGEVMDSQSPYLDSANTQALFQWMLALIKLYSKHNLGAVSLEAAKALREGREEEKCRDLRALLKMVTNMSDLRSMHGVLFDANGKSVDFAEAVLLGLNIVVPLMNRELLMYPRLCTPFFDLLSHVLEAYPGQVAALPTAPFLGLMAALEHGLNHADIAVTQACLEGLAGMMRFQYEALKMGGGAELAGHRFEGGEGVPAHFLRLLFQKLLLEDRSAGLTDLCAAPLLPIILCDPPAFDAVCASMAPPGGDSRASEAMGRAAGELMQIGAAGGDPMSRQARGRFRSNLGKFVGDVRGALRTF